MSIFSKLFLISIIFIINFNYSSLKILYTHPIKIEFDSSNLNLSNINDKKILLYLKELSKILSTMVNSINIKKVKISQNIVNEKCQEKNLKIEKDKTYTEDIVVIPFFQKLKNGNFKAAIFKIDSSFKISKYIQTFNERYSLTLEILKYLMDCLGLTGSFMANVRNPKNNYFQTPKYFLNNSNSYKSILKLYNISQQNIPKTDINKNGLFYTVFWDNNTILKDFRSERINIENDMSETSFELLNDMDYYTLTKCDLEYDNNGICHRIYQKCIMKNLILSII